MAEDKKYFDVVSELRRVKPYADIDGLKFFNSVQEGLEKTRGLRLEGKSFYVMEDGKRAEYIFEGGIDDSNLVRKVDEVPAATSENLGVVKADGVSIKNEGGVLSLNMDFAEGISPISIKPTTPLTELNALPNGIYRAYGEGEYKFEPKLQIIEGQGLNVIPPGYSVKFLKDANGWSVSVVEKLPIQDLSEIENSFDELTDAIKDSLLPDYKKYDSIDRPDLNRFIITDKDNNIIHITAEDSEVQEMKKGLLPSEYEYLKDNYDRPDLQGIIIINNEGDIIFPVKDIVESQVLNRLCISNRLNEYTTRDIFFKYENIISLYDELITYAPKYVSKKQIGITSINNIPIYSYIFKPKKNENLKKILLIGGTHASEKIYQNTLYYFAEYLVKNFTNNELLSFLRLECEVHIIPLLCPANHLDVNGSVGGGRRAAETLPIPITWSKNGNTTTIQLDINQFPNSNPNVNANDYFSYTRQNRLCVTIINSSDELLLPNNGYMLQSVINGSSITINSPNVSNGNGTAELIVYVDPNRNSLISDLFYTQSVSTVLSQYGSDLGKSVHDNPGTKPNSLSEVKSINDYILEEKFNGVIDAHSGAGNNYCTPMQVNSPNIYNTINYLTNTITSVNPEFSLTDGRGDIDEYKLTSRETCTIASFASYHNIVNATIEWSNPFNVTAKDANYSYNLLTSTINFLLTTNTY